MSELNQLFSQIDERRKVISCYSAADLPGGGGGGEGGGGGAGGLCLKQGIHSLNSGRVLLSGVA